MIEPLIADDKSVKTLYMTIYSFHMPAFIVISGMLSRAELNQKSVLKTVGAVLVPFVVFTLFYELFEYVTTGHPSSYLKNLRPYWMLWFLYSLFIWKMILPLFLRVSYPVTVSIALSLAAGYFESIGYFLGVSRTIYFFPFFVVGHKMTHKRLREMRIKYSGLLFRMFFSGIIVMNVLFFAAFDGIEEKWLYGSFSYSKLGYEGLDGLMMRALLLLMAFSTLFSFLMLVPNSKNRLFSRGKNSLYVYVWHGFFIKVFVGIGLVSMVAQLPLWIALSVFFIVSALLTLLLSRDFIAEKTHRLFFAPVERMIYKKLDKN